MIGTQYKTKRCSVGGKFGHFARVCHYRKNIIDGPNNHGGKDIPNPQVNILIGFGSARDERYELTLKQIWFINLQWWIDTSVNVLVCSNFLFVF